MLTNGAHCENCGELMQGTGHVCSAGANSKVGPEKVRRNNHKLVQIYCVLAAVALIYASSLIGDFQDWTSFRDGAAGGGWCAASFVTGVTILLITFMELIGRLRPVGIKWNLVGMSLSLSFGIYTLFTITFLLLNKTRVFNLFGAHAQPKMVIAMMLVGFVGLVLNSGRCRQTSNS